MDRFFYEEKQKVPVLLTWLVTFVGLGMTGAVASVIYRDMVLDQDTGANITKLAIVLVLLVVLLSFVIWLTASFYLEIKIGAEGIDYRYVPHYMKPMHVDRQSIVSYEIREMRLKDYFHSSLDRKLGSSTTGEVFTINASTVVDIQLVAGKRLVLGTNNKESVAHAMKKLLETRS